MLPIAEDHVALSTPDGQPVLDNDGNRVYSDSHWDGVVVTYNPSNQPEYSYVFLDSQQQDTDSRHTPIKGSLCHVFGQDNIELKQAKGIYQKPKTTCGGPELVENLMIHADVLPSVTHQVSSVELRQKHFDMAPRVAWVLQDPEEAIADALYLMDNERARQEFIDIINKKSPLDREIADAVKRWKPQLPEKQIALEVILKRVQWAKEDGHLLNPDKVEQRFSELHAEENAKEHPAKVEQRFNELHAEENAKEFIKLVNAAKPKEAIKFLQNISDPQKLDAIQKSDYYQAHLNNTFTSQVMDRWVTAQINSTVGAGEQMQKSLVQSVQNSMSAIYPQHKSRAKHRGKSPKQDSPSIG